MCQTTRDLGGLSKARRLLNWERPKQARLPELLFLCEPAPLWAPPQGSPVPPPDSSFSPHPVCSSVCVCVRASLPLCLSLSFCVSVCPHLSLSLSIFVPLNLCVCLCFSLSWSLCLSLSLSLPLPAALRLVMVPASL